MNFKVGDLVRVPPWLGGFSIPLALIVKIVPHPSPKATIEDAHVSLLMGEKIKSVFYGDLEFLNEEKV